MRQFCRAAAGFELLEIEARSISVKKTLALSAEDIGHLHGGPIHFLWYLFTNLKAAQIQPLEDLAGHMPTLGLS